MAFYNSFLNFNSYTPMLNFGCFNMPNFFSGFSSWSINSYSVNYFRPNVFSLFNKPIQMPFYQDYCSNLNNNQSVFEGFTNSSWQNINFQTPTFDSFNRTTYRGGNWQNTLKYTATSGTKEDENKYEYSSSSDIFATNNAKYLSGLTNEMQEKTKKLIAYANKEGYDVKITSGFRTQEEQKRLQKQYQNERGRVAKNSAHCEGMAIDISVTKNGENSDEGYNLLGNYAKTHLGLRWGQDFSSYPERWHFDCRTA